MNDLEERVKVLEEKVKILEETLETLKNMNLSEQMESYIHKRSQALKMVNLLNSVSDKPELDLSKEEEKVKAIQAKKNDLDIQIARALENTEDYSDINNDDTGLFSYEIETGVENTVSNHTTVSKEITALKQYVGKGVRITGYNGLDIERIVVPNEIGGKPVVCIGENAFKDFQSYDIKLPGTLKAILMGAFSGCINLKHIIVPKDVEYLGYSCFSSSGITEFVCPDLIDEIPKS